MKALKIKVYLQFSNFRKPLSYGFIDTYPLPPHSTIKGWLHKILDAKEYKPMALSIQGRYTSVVFDLQKILLFDRKDRGTYLPDFNSSLKSSITYVANIFDLNLIIHVLSEGSILANIVNNIYNDFQSIGRHEDIARIDEVNFVEIDKKSISLKSSYRIKNGIYLKKDTANRFNLRGINYRINYKYDIINNFRFFNKKDVIYVDRGEIRNSDIFVDEENDLVDFIGDEKFELIC